MVSGILSWLLTNSNEDFPEGFCKTDRAAVDAFS
jgi:hypothetical protein